MASFARGLSDGFGVGLQIGGAWKRRDMNKEAATATADPEEIKAFSEGQGEYLRGLAEKGADVRYEDGQYKVYHNGKQMDSVSGNAGGLGVYRLGGRTFETIDGADVGAYQSERLAKVYDKYGETEKARGVRKEMRDYQRQGRQDAMAAKMNEAQLESMGLSRKVAQGQLDEQEYTRGQRAATDAYGAALAEAGANNAQLNTAQKLQIASQYNVNPKAAMEMVLAEQGVTLKDFEFRATVRLRQAQEAMQAGGLEGLQNLYRNGEMFQDGVDFDFKRTPKGVVITWMKDGKPTRTMSEMPEQHAMAMAMKQLSDPAAALDLEMSVGKYLMGMRKDESEIIKNDRVGRAVLINANDKSANGAAALMGSAYNKYVELAKSKGMKSPEAETWAWKEVNDARLTRDAVPLDPVKRYELQGMVEDRLSSTPGWEDMDAVTRGRLVERETQKVLGAQGGAAGSWMDALGDDPAPKSQGGATGSAPKFETTPLPEKPIVSREIPVTGGPRGGGLRPKTQENPYLRLIRSGPKGVNSTLNPQWVEWEKANGRSGR